VGARPGRFDTGIVRSRAARSPISGSARARCRRPRANAAARAAC
jgi:hypothetical protein